MKKSILFSAIVMLFAIHINAQKIINQNGKYGVTYDDGKILTELKYDSAYIPDQEKKEEGGAKIVFTQKNNKYGVIIFPSDTLPIVIEPKFDAIFFQNYYYLVVKQNNKYGFIAYSSRYGATDAMKIFSGYRVWIKNVFISEIEYDKISNRQLFKDNKCGYLFQGRLEYGSGKSLFSYRVVPAIYETLEFLINNQIVYYTYNKFENLEEGDSNLRETFYYVFKVKNNGFVNYLSVNGKVADKTMHTLFLNNTYEDEELFYVEGGLFIINQLGKPLQLYNVVDSTFKIISDEQGKALILDKYYRFKGDRWRDEDPVCIFYGESRDSKNFITFFTNVNKKENSLIFKDTTNPVYLVDYHSHYRYTQVYGRYGSYYGADKQIVQQADFTAFISSVTDRVENLSIKDFSLLSFPDKKVVYSTSFNSKNETIKINYPKPEKLDCCCPYFQIVKFTTKDDEYNTTKKQVLGYINYKTFQFSKKKPAGCEDDKENKLSGEMYKE